MSPESFAFGGLMAFAGLAAYLHQTTHYCEKNPRPKGSRLYRFMTADHCDHHRQFDWPIQHGTHVEHRIRAVMECCWCKRKMNNFDDMQGVDYDTVNWVDKPYTITAAEEE